MPQQKNKQFRDERGENTERDVPFRVNATAAATDYEVTIFSDDRNTTANPSAEGVEIADVSIEPDTTITGAATNNATLTVEQYHADGTHVATLGTKAFTSGAVTAPANRRTSLASNATLAVGDYLTLKAVHAGSGLALPALSGTVRHSDY